ncbi:MAG: tripartite tricarboxylate transporter substrate binding protein [Acetobacteraceae bacterium]|nr:tripartite tricarboxylate transporter substrate binding protein [Acetobacteraceae bacterium]
MTRRAFLAAAALAAARPAIAQEWVPTQPIRMVVPYPPGGTTDVLGRMVAEGMSERLGRQVVVDNRSGASGIIGTEWVRNAAPDGHTLVFVSSGHGVLRELYPNLPFDPNDDFTPVARIAGTAYALVAHPILAVTDIAGLIALAKARPGAISFASTGMGTAQHLAGELFKRLAGIDIVHIPYRGSGTVRADLMTGRVPVMFENLALMAPVLQRGELRGLAVTGADRSPLVPAIPTMAESGFPEATIEGWFGLLGPKGMPAPTVAALNAAANATLESPMARQRMAGLGARVMGGTPRQLDELIRTERARWGAVIRDANIRPE